MTREREEQYCCCAATFNTVAQQNRHYSLIMEARQPTFMLLPSFNYLPDRDLRLGSIITSARGSRLPDAPRLLNPTTRVTVPPEDIQM